MVSIYCTVLIIARRRELRWVRWTGQSEGRSREELVNIQAELISGGGRVGMGFVWRAIRWKWKGCDHGVCRRNH
jgi:hypothetical protein